MHVPVMEPAGEDAVVTEPVVGEDAALGVQPARALSLRDPDVAEDRWVHVATSPRGNQTSGIRHIQVETVLVGIRSGWPISVYASESQRED